MKNLIKGKREPTTSLNIKKRFWEKVKKTKTCWIWQGFKCKRLGHGQFQTIEKVDYAHRYSWILHYGKIQKGKFVLHKCDNGSCVNPKHLFLGTQKDNVYDMTKKGRYANRILTNDQIKEIKETYKFRVMTQEMLAQKYKVNPMTIGRIIRKESHLYE